jgi:hypothetical protein
VRVNGVSLYCYMCSLMDSEQGQVIIPVASLCSGQELRGWFPVTPIDARSSTSSSSALGRSGRLAADTLAALGLTAANDSSNTDTATAAASAADNGSDSSVQRQHRRTDNNSTNTSSANSSDGSSRAEILLRVQLVPKPAGAAVTDEDMHASTTIEAMLSKVCNVQNTHVHCKELHMQHVSQQCMQECCAVAAQCYCNRLCACCKQTSAYHTCAYTSLL